MSHAQQDEVKAIFHAHVTDPVIVDLQVYSCWLHGLRADEAAARRRDTPSGAALQHSGLTGVHLLRDTRDQYRMFQILEHYLCEPQYLRDQPVIRLSPAMQSKMLEMYYQFDPLVFRELIGRRLTSKIKNNLDDVSEKTKISLRSCQRQFENLRRVFKKVEELDGAVREKIQYHFFLSKPLAGEYARVVFLCFHRFEVSKKKLSVLEFSDYAFFAHVFMSHWSSNRSLDLDPTLIEELKEIKSLLSADRDTLEDLRQVIKLNVAKSIRVDKLNRADGKIVGLLRSILVMAAEVAQSKDFRDIFTDMVEKIVDVLKKLDFDNRDADQLFIQFANGFEYLQVVPRHIRSKLMPSWHRFLTGVKGCVLHMYDRVP